MFAYSRPTSNLHSSVNKTSTAEHSGKACGGRSTGSCGLPTLILLLPPSSAHKARGSSRTSASWPILAMHLSTTSPKSSTDPCSAGWVRQYRQLERRPCLRKCVSQELNWLARHGPLWRLAFPTLHICPLSIGHCPLLLPLLACPTFPTFPLSNSYTFTHPNFNSNPRLCCAISSCSIHGQGLDLYIQNGKDIRSNPRNRTYSSHEPIVSGAVGETPLQTVKNLKNQRQMLAVS
eukprot:04179_4